MRTIDLNADLGEGYGRWPLDDRGLLDLVSSANVACGFHAGDPQVMERTVADATARGVAIGAHPGYPDLRGFGRRELGATPDEIRADVTYQRGALAAFCMAAGTRLRYVKPHGALYNRAARDEGAARAIAEAVGTVDTDLAVLTLPGSALAHAAESCGLRAAREAFLDRAYRADGTLVPRGEPGAVLHDPADAAARAVRLATEGTLLAADGTVLSVTPDSLCVHGDGEGAVALLRTVRDALTAAGLTIHPFAG